MDAPGSVTGRSLREMGFRASGARVAFPHHLSRRSVWWAMAGLSLLSLLVLGGTWLDLERHLLPNWTPGWLRFLVAQSNLAAENAGAAWFSSLLFLTLAPAALACLWLELVSPSTWKRRALALAWLALAGAAVLLSLTELGSLHERSQVVVDNPFSGVLYGWVGVLAIPILLAGGLLAWLAWRWMREDRAAFWLMLAGVLLYLTVPLQEQLEAIMRMAAQEATGEFHRPVIYALLEEGAELFGTILLLGALGLYAVSRMGEFSRRGVLESTRRAPDRTAWRGGPRLGGGDRDALSGTLLVPRRGLLQAAWTLVAVFVLGFLAMQLALMLWIPTISEYHGLPLNWFPSMLAAIVAAACLYMGWAARRLSGASGGLLIALTVTGLYSLLVSLDRGADLAISGQLWEGSPRWQAAVDVAFAAGAAGSAAALWRWGSGALRPAAVAWALLLGATFLLQPDGIGAVLVTLGYATLLPSLASHWADVARRQEEVGALEERRAPSSAALVGRRGGMSSAGGR